jgi:hypothetical protein
MMPRALRAASGALLRPAVFAILLVLFCVAPPVHAQDPPAFEALPDSIVGRVLSLYNAPGTTRFAGDLRIAAGTTIAGNVAILGGTTVIGGRIDGNLVIINALLSFEEGAEVTGDVVAVGGTLTNVDAASVGGRVSHHTEPLPYRQLADGTLVHSPPAGDGLSAGRDFPFGRTDVLLAARNGYNRTEGLPLQLGPRVRIGQTNPMHLQAFAIFRTARDLDDLAVNRLGYALRAEQFLGGRRELRIGARVFSEILPIQTGGLSDRENSFGAFVLRRDYRDVYETDGWSAYVRYAPPGGRSDITLEYADERHRAVAPANTWSMLRRDEVWRPNPVVAEGELRTVAARFAHDSRNEDLDPSAGWLIRLGLEQGVGGGLRTPTGIETPDTGPFITQARDRFTSGTLDVRRYARVSPYSRVALRLYASGSVDGATLPPQRQRALGGEGTLPAFGLFEFDCGARDEVVRLRSRDFFPHYGCDRAVLLQFEYQAGFPFLPRLGRSLGLPLDFGQQVRWAALLDAGHAWIEPGSRGGRDAEAGFAADAGLGVRIGQLGFYWAVPLSDHGSGVNFFVRLGRRF